MAENIPSQPGSVVAGIDVGGTFTDLILIDGPGGAVRIAKTPTTVDNQAFGVVTALAASGFPVKEIDLIVHGTTTTTNAVTSTAMKTRARRRVGVPLLMKACQ